jgi:hypothetical protein
MYYHLFFLIFIFCCDWFSKTWIKDNAKSRWFLIHCIGNLAIFAICIGPVFRLLKDPINVIQNPIEYNLPLDFVTILHIFHLVRYKCSKADYFHHFVFVTIGNVIRHSMNSGEVLSLAVSNVCGLPGAIDFAALYAIDKKLITKKQRIVIASIINTWFRSPGLMFCFTLQYIIWATEPKIWHNNFMFLCGAIVTMMNGQYYLQQVLITAGEKYHIKAC